jgi:hypothetical protein
MKHNNLPVHITLWVNRIIAVVLTVLPFLLPAILDWYAGFRYLTIIERRTVAVSFICCAVVILWALWNMDSMLRSILSGDVFTRKNVRSLRHVQWCCAIVAVLCVVATFAYLPLVFLSVIMGFLFLTICVVSNVMDAAVAIREENDLTI